MKLLKPIIYFLIFAGLMAFLHGLLVAQGYALNSTIHQYIFVMHLFSLLSVVLCFWWKPDFAGFAFLGLILFKMALVLYIMYQIPDFKTHVLWYFGLYWLYLGVELLLIVRCLLAPYNKNHKI
jgi:hypothetical protein